MKIAVTCEVEYLGKPQQARSVINQDYLDYVIAGGGIPFVVTHMSSADDIADEMDGLLLTGGKDINPLLQGEDLQTHGSQSCNLVRDVFERDLYKAFVRRGKPVFGICRGFQVIGIVNRLVLMQDIQCYHKEIHIQHQQRSVEIDGINPVHVMMNRKLIKHLIGGITTVNSFHHQGFFIKGQTSAKGFYNQDPSVLGWSRSRDKGKVLEALILHVSSVPENEHLDTIVGGVQYHPERLIRSGKNVERHLKLFQYVMGIAGRDIDSRYNPFHQQQTA